MENSRNKQFINFKLHAVLSSVIKSYTVLLHAAWDVTFPLVCKVSGNVDMPKRSNKALLLSEKVSTYRKEHRV